MNPERDYVSENIFSLIGGFIIWSLKGFRGKINNEVTKKNKLRNVFVVLLIWIIFLLIVVYFYIS